MLSPKWPARRPRPSPPPHPRARFPRRSAGENLLARAPCAAGPGALPSSRAGPCKWTNVTRFCGLSRPPPAAARRRRPSSSPLAVPTLRNMCADLPARADTPPVVFPSCATLGVGHSPSWKDVFWSVFSELARCAGAWVMVIFFEPLRPPPINFQDKTRCRVRAACGRNRWFWTYFLKCTRGYPRYQNLQHICMMKMHFTPGPCMWTKQLNHN